MEITPSPDIRAGDWSYDDFMRDYDPSWATYQSSSTRVTPLEEAVGNRDPDARFLISNQLLDDGANPRVASSPGAVLINLLECRNLGERDVVLLRRLLDAGADVNASVPKFGRPVFNFLTNYSVDFDTIKPMILDVLFSRPELDLVFFSKLMGKSFGRALIDSDAGIPPGARRPELTSMEERVREHLLGSGFDPDVVLSAGPVGS